MKILLTGASGFLGGYLLNHFHSLGIVTDTVGRKFVNSIVCDLARDMPKLEIQQEYDLVVHNAGLAHKVPKNEREAQAFFDVNSDGTRNLLQGLLSLEKKPTCIVLISTVAVYGLESGVEITEDFPLKGTTPYAQSKIEAEKLVQEWAEEQGVNCVILRLPLVVGENAPGNLGAMERAIKKGYYFRLGSGNARRSMVNAVDIAKLIPTLLDKNGIFNLCNELHKSYAEIDTELAQKHGKRVKRIPVWMGKMMAKVGDFVPGFPLNTYRLTKLEKSLTFSDEKAVRELNWRSR